MLAYFFRHGLVVVINSIDQKATEPRALEIAAQMLKEASFTEAPSLSGVAILPQDGVVTAWHRNDGVYSATAEYAVSEDAVHRIADDKIEALRSEMQEEIDRNVRDLEEKIDSL
jgi:hypothetical protein